MTKKEEKQKIRYRDTGFILSEDGLICLGCWGALIGIGAFFVYVIFASSNYIYLVEKLIGFLVYVGILTTICLLFSLEENSFYCKTCNKKKYALSLIA